MTRQGHAYQISTAQGHVLLGVPFSISSKIASQLESAIRTVLDESRPAQELVEYIQTLTPTAGTPQGALRGYLTSKGWSQKTLSLKTGISPAHISEMLSGKRPIGPLIAKKLGKALSVDYRRFL